MDVQKFLYNLPIPTKLVGTKVYMNVNKKEEEILDLKDISYKTDLDLKISIYSKCFKYFPRVRYNFFFLKSLYPQYYTGVAIIDRIFLLEGIFRLNINFDVFLMFVSKIKLGPLLMKIRKYPDLELNESHCSFIKDVSIVEISEKDISEYFLEAYKKVNPNIIQKGHYIIIKPFKIKKERL